MTYRSSLDRLTNRIITQDSDTWSSIFRPSPDETLEEKKDRIARQQEANRISREIDEGIERSKKLLDKRKKAIKVLLLGQAESGKSTMLRNFQLAFCPNYFHDEIPIWKTIIQLNLIGSVSRLLAIIEHELDSQASRSPRSLLRQHNTSTGGSPVLRSQLQVTPPSSSSGSWGSNISAGDVPIRRSPTDHVAINHPDGPSSSSPSTSRGGTSGSSSTSRHVAAAGSRTNVGVSSSHNTAASRNHVSHSEPTDVQDSADPPLTQAHSALRLRLLPLLSVETNLARQLLPEWGGDVAAAHSNSGAGWAKWASGGTSDCGPGIGLGGGELCVRAGGAWKGVIERVSGAACIALDTNRRPSVTDRVLSHQIDPVTPSGKHTTRTARPHPSDPTPLLEALASDIHVLWTDPAVQALLKRRGIRMEDSAGFFLNDIMRIGKPGWKPAVDDIVRARLRTFGVEEHKFLMENGSEWYIYDVGGSRNMRPQWVPFFDDVQAIIFLAPLVFNQVLDEDRGANRLEDSIGLWKEVCSSPLLARANIILFLNKMDILESTLKAGIRVSTYVPSYGSQPNELEHVVKYFREKFRAYHKRLSPRQRTFFCHETSAIDTQATQAVLIGVREGILRHHLEKLNVL
ncbi:G-alpha-domain-containing protein [Paxillus ammoniavirescens]|nr:G-alpha-domain-containing protein [Paxillus ammoniavirescens]